MNAELKAISNEFLQFYKDASEKIEKKRTNIEKKKKDMEKKYEDIRNNLNRLERDKVEFYENLSNHYGGVKENELLPEKKKEYLLKEFDAEKAREELERLEILQEIENKHLKKKLDEYNEEYKQLYFEKKELDNAMFYQALGQEYEKKLGIFIDYNDFKSQNDLLIKNLFNKKEN